MSQATERLRGSIQIPTWIRCQAGLQGSISGRSPGSIPARQAGRQAGIDSVDSTETDSELFFNGFGFIKFSITRFYAVTRPQSTTHYQRTCIPYETGSRRAPWPRFYIHPFDTTQFPAPLLLVGYSTLPQTLPKRRLKRRGVGMWWKGRCFLPSFHRYTDFIGSLYRNWRWRGQMVMSIVVSNVGIRNMFYHTNFGGEGCDHFCSDRQERPPGGIPIK